MDYYSLSDKAIEKQLGQRLRALRLRNNITQQELAQSTNLSLNAIKAMENGRFKASTLIAVLRELGALEELEHFVPDTPISPLQLAKMQGRQRERASGKRQKNTRDESQW